MRISELVQGMVVSYVLTTGTQAGQTRPAQVVRINNDRGNVNLVVTLDGNNDRDCELSTKNIDGRSSLHGWATSVAYDEEKKPGTWH